LTIGRRVAATAFLEPIRASLLVPRSSDSSAEFLEADVVYHHHARRQAMINPLDTLGRRT